MQHVKLEEIVDIAQYERLRPEFRGKAMAEKDRRRVGVGPVFTFLFENHLTVLYQVQEMMRAERIVDEEAIAHEVRTYNELIPPGGGLGATLLIEYTDPAERAVGLVNLLGIEHHLRLELEGLPPVPGVFDTRQMSADKVSSVQYVSFPLTAAHREAWAALGANGGIRLVVDHPHYGHDTVLAPDVA
nr:DUF3501 family protein [Gammaproteobacteria bacterium]NIR98665.1 DUF3501 family protein [Gammaproteobacteria bacterium]NIT64379.1 DUF3501 family protein [Gammaproteobacteria bacterium]NIV21314.1 DUF3501 family protein [Gammaproteobacteria bacterium]NIY32959.1 DUF3501 family protein [Gammaproteobacteria bacterium]